MSHPIYHTDAFVITNRPTGEAGKYIYLFTKDFGFLGAVAQGVRKLESKLRFSLQDFSRVEVSLVRGKEVWRLTGAKKESDLHKILREEPDIFLVWARYFSLIKRLITGEEKTAEVFELTVKAYDFTLKEKIPAHLSRSFETLLVLRFLRYLGYFGIYQDLEEYTLDSGWNLGILEKFETVRLSAVERINLALKETQL